MELFPIIYTRTKYCDYNDNFHLSPNFINKEELLENVLIAANEFERCDDDCSIEIVFSCENYFVYGFYLLTHSFCKLDKYFENYCRDEFNRKTGIFVGFAALKNACNSIPIISLSDLAREYKKYIVPLWEEKFPLQSSQIPEPSNLKEENYNPCIIEKDYAYKQCTLFSEKNAEETKLITKNILYMAMHENMHIAYCSKVSSISDIDKRILTHAITTNDLISTIKYREQQIAIQEYNEAQRKKNIFQKLSDRLKRFFCRSINKKK